MGDTINWRRYNYSLKDRGKITFWLDEDFDDFWYSLDQDGGKIYSDRAIETLLTIRFKYHLTLRETEGFFKSLFEIMQSKLLIPHYSTLCRRMAGLSVQLRKRLDKTDPVHVVVDSTGLKVFGEGEWKVRTHGYSKRRTWRKLHLAVDENDNQILAVVLTTNDFKDNEVLPELMEQIKKDNIFQVTGDGAYDDKKCFKWAEENKIHAVFPPRRGARVAVHGNTRGRPNTRDKHIRQIRHVGRKAWKESNNYHRRSLAETAMFRFKTLVSGRLASRTFERQWTEVMVKLNILNKMETPDYGS